MGGGVGTGVGVPRSETGQQSESGMPLLIERKKGGEKKDSDVTRHGSPVAYVMMATSGGGVWREGGEGSGWSPSPAVGLQCAHLVTGVVCD